MADGDGGCSFSHGSYEYHGEVIANTRESYATAPLDGQPPAIALDTKGPEIRTGNLCTDTDPLLEMGSTVTIHTAEEWKPKCDAQHVWVDYRNIVNVMEVGQSLYIDDGLISLKVLSVDAAAGEMSCEVENSGLLGSHKGCNLPNVNVDLPALSDKDKADLTWGVGQGVDIIFASFIRKAADVHEVRACLVAADPVLGQRIKIISKIENHEGVQNFDEILAATDGVMVARGDLGIEIPAEKVFIAQKMMIAKCNAAGKSSICATQMLESMTVNPRPTRAEVSDVANAVLDGADCVMLSGETAKGKYPVEAVTLMSKTVMEAEAAGWSQRFTSDIRATIPQPAPVPEAVAYGAVQAANAVEAAAIICLSMTGSSLRLVSRFRPNCPILVISRDAVTCRQSHLHRGCYPFLVESEAGSDWFKDVESRIKWATDLALERGIAHKGATIVCVHESGPGEGQNNTFKIIEA